ncbi:lipocalin-like domain-containing protein [Tenacibaculum agarivorans]|uniref:lipocalin family protein n=1 Tax=Tenacibaculum agarivorans TaxID=1908389 RepID=UPI000A7E66E8|nr:lipocalin family protein [Tenacibaculum agarivorans]
MYQELKLGVLSLLAILLIGCSSDSKNVEIENSIIGTWKLIEIYNDSGDGTGSWKPVENGYTYNFSIDGQFTSTRFSECSSGNYTIDANQLTLDFDCNGFTTGIEKPEGIFIENYAFESNTVVFIPIYLNCVEGCGWKFEKLN